MHNNRSHFSRVRKALGSRLGTESHKSYWLDAGREFWALWWRLLQSLVILKLEICAIIGLCSLRRHTEVAGDEPGEWDILSDGDADARTL